jgi:hypothetical protein
MTNLMTEIPFDVPPQWQLGKYRANRSVRHEEAQSIIELALTVPLLLFLLLGSTEFARFAWAAVLTSNAARAGAAYGAQSPTKAGTVNAPGILTAAANESVNLPGLTTTSTVLCYCAYGPDTQGKCFPPDPDPLTVCGAIPLVDYIKVNTTSTVTVFGHQFTARGQSIMVIAK